MPNNSFVDGKASYSLWRKRRPFSNRTKQQRPLATGDLMLSDLAKEAFRQRAGLEFLRFVDNNVRLPNSREFQIVIGSGLNHVAMRMYVWRTGCDGQTGERLPSNYQPGLVRILLPLYRIARQREQLLREACFPDQNIDLVYFKPAIPDRNLGE